MIVKKINRYPIKGLNGEKLNSANLEIGAGIVGDRRFAFGVDETVNDGVWRSSRSYLINAVNDNLLKFTMNSEGAGWRMQNPQGETVSFNGEGSGSVNELNASMGSFMRSASKDAAPRLIDRKHGKGPRGHWDFPDSELLIVNKATIRELEKRWAIAIDPLRFRYNILVDGLPAWSEFGLYGSRLAIGNAQIDILRPARRCAATEVNPETGNRDEHILQRLVQDYGHGFLGVYAKVSLAGEIAIDQEFKRIESNVVSPKDAACEIAPAFGSWPKAAILIAESNTSFRFETASQWPLVDETATGNMKIHHGGGSPIIAEIQSVCGKGVIVSIDANEPHMAWANGRAISKDTVFVSGPFVPRRIR